MVFWLLCFMNNAIPIIKNPNVKNKVYVKDIIFPNKFNLSPSIISIGGGYIIVNADEITP